MNSIMVVITEGRYLIESNGEGEFNQSILYGFIET
jgi:hypothetical protein